MQQLESLVLPCGSSMVSSIVLIPVLSILLYKIWRHETDERKSKLERRGRVLLPSPPRLLPGWFGILSGHTLRLETKRATEQMENWADEFGEDYELQILGTRAVVVTDLDEIRRILVLRPSKFHRAMREGQMGWIGRAVGVVPTMFFDEGSEWGRSRRIIAPLLNGHNVEELIPAMSEVAGRFCLRWEARADARREEDALDAACRFAHDTICLAGLGLRADSVDKDRSQPCVTFDVINGITSTMVNLFYKPFAPLTWTYLPSTSWVKEAKRCSSVLEGIVHKLVRKSRIDVEGTDQEHRGDGAEGRQPEPGAEAGSEATAGSGEATHNFDRKILRKIVAAGGKTAGDRMAFSDERVVREVKSLFIAGTDTTGHSLAWTFYFIAERPELLARCRNEALEVAPETNGLVTTLEQFSRLVFCRAVFMESLRLRPAATRLVLHNVEDYTMKNGFEAPKGTAFFLLTRYMALSEEAFTRAREFIPERWIEAEREDALLGDKVGDGERTVRHREEAFLAFGSGPRSCPGQEMAKTEATILLAAACARFNVSLAPGQPNPPEEVTGFTSRPEVVEVMLTRA